MRQWHGISARAWLAPRFASSIRSAPSPPQPGMRSSAIGRFCRTRFCTRCTKPAAPRRKQGGRRAISQRGVARWSWADAYRRHGRHYYPKLVCAIPFTPATGPRLIAADSATRGELLAGALSLVAEDHLSSLHILFPQADEAYACAAAGMLLRDSVQFHWTNPGYRDFADFLSTMNHTKRKRISQERRKLGAAGVTFRRLLGREIDGKYWAFF